MRVFAQLVYSISILAAASLMFLLEPFVAKLLLPKFGGGPNVWNTCVLFFQTVLLFAYCYAHLITSRLPSLWQLVLQLIVVWSPMMLMPIRAPLVVPEGDPSFVLSVLLIGIVGGCFFAISTTAPLLQRWYSRLKVAGANDPYFLYAASNVGGIVGLLSYPFLVEPNFRLSEQGNLFSIVYAGYAVLISVCAIVMWRQLETDTTAKDLNHSKVGLERDAGASERVEEDGTSSDMQAGLESGVGSGASPMPDGDILNEPEISNRLDSKTAKLHSGDTSDTSLASYLRWLLFTIIPSSLVLGVTSYVTSQLSSIPLFWMIPLLVYLLSFIIAFGRIPNRIMRVFRTLAPLTVLLAVMSDISLNLSVLLWQGDWYLPTLLIHLVALFLCAYLVMA